MRNQDSGDRLDWTALKPPTYLLGTTLLFWGLLSGHPLMGLAAGLLLECHRWLNWRWKFSDQDYIRVWNLCVVLFLVVAVFQVVDRDFGRWQLTRVFQIWMPLLLFPMIWAQYFAQGKDVPMLTFSLVARRKRLYDERAGRRIKEPRRAHLGYFYFAILLLSIGAAGREAPRIGEFFASMNHRLGFGAVSSVYVIVSILLAWALSVFVSRRGWALAGALFLVSIFFGHHLHHGLRFLHGVVESKTMEWMSGRQTPDANSSRTQFGKVGALKLSPKVFWRAKHIDGKRSTLLPDAIYQVYEDREWRNKRPNSTLQEVDKIENTNQWEIENIGDVGTSVMEIRGRVHSKEETIPRLENTGLILELEASNLEKNSLGTLVLSPSYTSIKYALHTGKLSPGKLESLPDKEDLLIADREHDHICQRAKAFRIRENASTRERIRAVERFFSDPANNFRYTQYLRGIGVNDLGTRESHLSHFLKPTGRSGHCEYYATSTVLLLRALGVNARYVVGYALKELDKERGEWVIRGTHRHAWVRAWLEDEECWVNVDTTPFNWFAVENKALSSLQNFLDRWDHWMLSWNLWRRADDKGWLWTFLPVILAGGLLIIVVLRLVRGLRKSQNNEAHSRDRSEKLAMLGMDSAWFELERTLAEHEWPRPPSQSVGDWCRQLMIMHPEWRNSLSKIVNAHYRLRFDPQGLTEKEVATFREITSTFQEMLSEDSPDPSA